MKTLSAIVILLILYLPARQCMSQTGGDSANTSAVDVVEAELIGFSKHGLRVRSAAGAEELFPLDDLQAYRLVDGRLEVKHISGRVMALPPEALGDSTSLKEGQWQMLSLDGVDARYVDVEVVGRDSDDEIRLRTLDGEHEYEIGELVAYRVKGGKVQIKHESGIVLVTRLEIVSEAARTAGGKWRNISGENSARREALFPGSRRRQGAVSSMEKELEEIFGEIPLSLIALGLACLVVNIALLICFGLVICAMFLNGEITTGLVCTALTCVTGSGPLLGLYYGWRNCQAWRIQKLMIVWSVLWVIGIALNIILWVSLPDLLMQLDPRLVAGQA